MASRPGRSPRHLHLDSSLMQCTRQTRQDTHAAHQHLPWEPQKSHPFLWKPQKSQSNEIDVDPPKKYGMGHRPTPIWISPCWSPSSSFLPPSFSLLKILSCDYMYIITYILYHIMLFANPWSAATIFPLLFGFQWMSQNAEHHSIPWFRNCKWHEKGEQHVETNTSIMLFALPPCYIHAKLFIKTYHNIW